MGMSEYNADNKTTRLVGKWGFRKGGYSNDADLEKSSARQLPLWANVWGTGRRIHRDLYDALLCTNVYADGALNRSKRK